MTPSWETWEGRICFLKDNDLPYAGLINWYNIMMENHNYSGKDLFILLIKNVTVPEREILEKFSQ